MASFRDQVSPQVLWLFDAIVDEMDDPPARGSEEHEQTLKILSQQLDTSHMHACLETMPDARVDEFTWLAEQPNATPNQLVAFLQQHTPNYAEVSKATLNEFRRQYISDKNFERILRERKSRG